MTNLKTIKLLERRLIGHNHLEPGTRVTVGYDVADALIKAKQATQVAFDESAVIPPPQPRRMYQTASVNPVQSTTAVISGRATK